MLVRPTTIAPAASSRSSEGRGRVGPEPEQRARAVGRLDALLPDHVLDARPGRRPAGRDPRRPRPARRWPPRPRGAAAGRTSQKALSVPLSRAIRSSESSTTSTARAAAGAHVGRDRGRAEASGGDVRATLGRRPSCQPRAVVPSPLPWIPSRTLDALDRSILAALQLDGRRPFRVIARDLDVSEGTVRTRVRKLEESGVLRILAFVDPLKLGDALIAVLNVRVASAVPRGGRRRDRELGRGLVRLERARRPTT